MSTLTCPICLDNFSTEGSRIPCFLSCGHSFCKSDLDAMAKDVRRVKCPVCRTKSKCVHAPNYVLIEALRQTKGEPADNVTLSSEGANDSSDADVDVGDIQLQEGDAPEGEEEPQDEGQTEEPETSLSSSVATRRDDFKRLIASDPENPDHYYNLALCTPPQIKIKLLDSSWVTQSKLLHTTIHLEPNVPRGYAALAATLPKGVTTKLFGREVTKISLYKDALRIDPHFSAAYVNLAMQLDDHETITIAKTKYNKLALLKKALALNPDNARAYYLIATSPYTKTGCVRLFETDMSREALLKKVLAIDPEYSRAYNKLGMCLKRSTSSTRVGGVKMTKVELFKKALALDPNYAEAMSNLSNCINTCSTKLHDGTVITKSQLRQTAQTINGKPTPCCTIC